MHHENTQMELNEQLVSIQKKRRQSITLLQDMNVGLIIVQSQHVKVKPQKDFYILVNKDSAPKAENGCGWAQARASSVQSTLFFERINEGLLSGTATEYEDKVARVMKGLGIFELMQKFAKALGTKTNNFLNAIASDIKLKSVLRNRREKFIAQKQNQQSPAELSTFRLPENFRGKLMKHEFT